VLKFGNGESLVLVPVLDVLDEAGFAIRKGGAVLGEPKNTLANCLVLLELLLAYVLSFLGVVGLSAAHNNC